MDVARDMKWDEGIGGGQRGTERGGGGGGKQRRRAVRDEWDVRCFPSSGLEFIV